MSPSPLPILDVFSKDLFRGRTVFVTGGGSGINLGIARNFAAVGANLSLCGRTDERLQAARKELESLGAKVSTSVADVRDYDALTAAMKTTEEDLGPISVLVCGAAGNFLCPAEQLSPGGFKAVVDIDLLGSFNASRAAFDQLKKTRGSILFVSAGQGDIPYFAQSHVGAAKAGVDNLMSNLALEWGRFGIRSNGIVPGPIAGTEGMNRLAPGPIGEALEKAVPLGRFGTTDDIGQTAVYLASDLASYVTGALVRVDGGLNLSGSGLFTEIVRRGMAAAGETRSDS